jgi:hypothetical protein
MLTMVRMAWLRLRVVPRIRAWARAREDRR